MDPHTAIGLICAKKLKMSEVMCLACAHPVKFQDTVKKSLSKQIQYDKKFNFDHEEKFEVISNNYLKLKEYIQNNA